jgi:hypothetical protein
MSAGKRNPIAYFCHAESDKELVAQVNEGLTKLNIRCLQSPSEVRTESAFLREITNAFNVADLVVLVVSADLLTTVSARRELDLIIARRLAKSPKGAVLPVLTDNSQLPSVLRDLKSLDLHEMNGEKAAESLMEAVISRLTERAVLFGLKR